MLRLILIVTAMLGLAACETIQGAGRDVSSAGRTITAESQAVQDEM